VTQTAAVSTLYQWFKENTDSFLSKNAEIEFKDSGQGRAMVRTDTVNYMAELRVWDKKYKLVIDIINRDTDEETLLFNDECQSNAAFEEQLAEFVKWFEKDA